MTTARSVKEDFLIKPWGLQATLPTFYQKPSLRISMAAYFNKLLEQKKIGPSALKICIPPGEEMIEFFLQIWCPNKALHDSKSLHPSVVIKNAWRDLEKRNLTENENSKGAHLWILHSLHDICHWCKYWFLTVLLGNLAGGNGPSWQRREWGEVWRWGRGDYLFLLLIKGGEFVVTSLTKPVGRLSQAIAVLPVHTKRNKTEKKLKGPSFQTCILRATKEKDEGRSETHTDNKQIGQWRSGNIDLIWKLAESLFSISNYQNLLT